MPSAGVNDADDTTRMAVDPLRSGRFSFGDMWSTCRVAAMADLALRWDIQSLATPLAASAGRTFFAAKLVGASGNMLWFERGVTVGSHALFDQLHGPSHLLEEANLP